MSNSHIVQWNKQLPKHIRETPPLYNIFMTKLILTRISCEGNLTEIILKKCDAKTGTSLYNYLQGFKKIVVFQVENLQHCPKTREQFHSYFFDFVNVIFIPLISIPLTYC